MQSTRPVGRVAELLSLGRVLHILDASTTYFMYPVSLIVGNGFDLNIGLRTSYADFLRSDFYPRDEDAASLAAHLKARHEIEGWVDVEAEIASYSASQPSRVTLKLEYKALRDALCGYIQSIDKAQIPATSKAFEVFKKLAASTPLNVITFNYTRTIESLIDGLRTHGINAVADIIHLHGTAESRDIIFGVDDHAGISDRHSFLFKTSARNFAGRGIVQMLLQSSETHWFGHSLGSPDHMYFREYFSVVVDQLTDRTFNFYHYGDNGSDALHTQLQALTQRRVAKFKSNHICNFVDVS